MHRKTSQALPRWVSPSVTTVALTALVGGGLALGGVLPTTSASAAETTVSSSATISTFNGTFESGLGGWSAGQGTTMSQVAGRGSAKAVRITNTGPVATTLLNDVTNSVKPTQAGTVYRVSAWVRASQANLNAAIRVMEFPSWDSGKALTERGNQVGYLWLRNTDWQPISLTYTAKESNNTLDFNAMGWDLPKGASLDVDDIAIVKVQTVAAPAPAPVTTTAAAATTSLNPAVNAALPQPGKGAKFGFWQAGGANFSAAEVKMNATFGAAHRYQGFNGTQLWPSDADKAMANQGKTLHVSWETMNYLDTYNTSLQPAPAVKAYDAHSKQWRSMWGYTQITNGSLDRYIDTIATRVKQLGKPIIIDFNHEADDIAAVGGSNTQRAATGTPSEYAAAYRHIVTRFRAQGVTNVVWAVTWSGWTVSDTSKQWIFKQLWPGKGYVDLILWDPYNNKATNWRSFAQLVTPMYSALRAGLLDSVDPSAKNLRYGLGEFGSVADPRRPQWLRDIPGQIKMFPQMTYVNYYSSGSWGQLHDDPASLDALGTALRDPYFID